MTEIKANKKKISFANVHKLSAGVALICFGVIVAAGMMAEVRVSTMAYRAIVVTLVISLISRVVVSILASYEEMNSGET